MKEKIRETKSGYYDSNGEEFNVSFVPHKSGTYKIEVNGVIEDVGQFSTAIQVLQMAKEDDEVEIYLQCPGGNLDATDALIHAIRKCDAPIHVVATGGCHSAATLILLQAHSFELSENFNSLLHCGSTGSIGNLNEYQAQTKFNNEFVPNIFRKYYEGFLTSDEIEDMLKGQDIWLNAEQWVNRHQQRNDYFRAKQEAIIKASKKRKPKKTVEQ